MSHLAKIKSYFVDFFSLIRYMKKEKHHGDGQKWALVRGHVNYTNRTACTVDVLFA